MADEAAGLNAIVNPDAPEFLDGRDAPPHPGLLRSHGQHAIPQSPGEIVRCAPGLLGAQLPRGRRRPRRGDRPRDSSVNIVGGGSNNAPLPAHRRRDRPTGPLRPRRGHLLGNAATSSSPGAFRRPADIRRVIVGTTDITRTRRPRAPTGGRRLRPLTRLLARDRERLDLAVEIMSDS